MHDNGLNGDEFEARAERLAKDLMNSKGGSRMFKYLVGGIVSVIATVLFLTYGLSVVSIKGDQRAVVQDWQEGVLNDIWVDKTHFYIKLFTEPTVYKIGSEKFIMGKDKFYSGTGADVVDYPAFEITTGGPGQEQPATFSMTLNYRLDPTKLITLHSKARSEYEDLVIKPALTRIISDMATPKTVLQFYSGEGRVNLQKEVEAAIASYPSLSEVGIIVETFVIDDISLDEDYVAEITGRQLATQKKLRAIEEAKAAQEVAKRVEAEAEAEKLKRLVRAEALKQESIKAAEAENESRILAAKAHAQEIKEKASAERFRKEQDAKGLLAQGMAEAKVAEAKRDSKYKGESGERQMLVEVSKSRTELFKNMKVQGILDKDVALTIINSTDKLSPVLPVMGAGK